jgi:hypothetical protein
VALARVSEAQHEADSVTELVDAAADKWNRAAFGSLWGRHLHWEVEMGRSILLLLLGVPLPIILLLALVWH